MRYVIVCLIKGEAGEFHSEMVKSVSRSFNVQGQKLPAHFTIKAPFEYDDISEIEKITDEFCNNASKSSFMMEGYDHFKNNVVFMDIKPSKETISAVESYISALKVVPNLQWKPNEKGKRRFHCTIVSRMPEDKYTDIWNFVHNHKYSYQVYFDNISILIWSKYRWVTHKEYSLK